MHVREQVSKFVMPPSFFRQANVWILKVTGFNRGVGIHVFNQISDLYKLLKEYSADLPKETSMQQCLALLGQHCNVQEIAPVHKESEYPKSVSFIIQKYMESPMLV